MAPTVPRAGHLFGFFVSEPPREPPHVHVKGTGQRADCLVGEAGRVLWWPALREAISLTDLLGVSETELEEFVGVYPRR